MKTNFDQAGPPTDTARQTLISRVGSMLRKGYETVTRDVGAAIALGATVFAVAQAVELTLNAEPVSGEGNTPGRVSTPEAGIPPEATQSSGTVTHTRSNLNIQPILNKIRHIALPHDLLVPQDKLNWVKPISAFVEPSTAEFRTNCSKGWAGYRFFEITTAGTSYITCGPQLVPPELPHSTPNQYARAENALGNKIQRSVGLSYDESTARVGGNRKRITARYQCPPPETDPNQPGSAAVQPAGVAKIAIRRNHTANVAMC